MNVGRIRTLCRPAVLAFTVAIGLLLALTPGLTTGPPGALAAPAVFQDIPTPPDLGDLLFRSGLTAPDVFSPGTCPTGLAGGENVGEGFKLTVRGRCVPEATAANLPVSGRGISAWDGDVTIEFQVAVGAERAGINLYVRNQGTTGMAAYVNLAKGEAEIFKRVNGINVQIASRQDIRTMVDPAAWTRLSLRFKDDAIWMLLDDVPVLFALEAVDQSGGIGIGVVREGNADDRGEVAVVFRNLTLSALAEVDAE